MAGAFARGEGAGGGPMGARNMPGLDADQSASR